MRRGLLSVLGAALALSSLPAEAAGVDRHVSYAAGSSFDLTVHSATTVDLGIGSSKSKRALTGLLLVRQDSAELLAGILDLRLYKGQQAETVVARTARLEAGRYRLVGIGAPGVSDETTLKLRGRFTLVAAPPTRVAFVAQSRAGSLPASELRVQMPSQQSALVLAVAVHSTNTGRIMQTDLCLAPTQGLCYPPITSGSSSAVLTPGSTRTRSVAMAAGNGIAMPTVDAVARFVDAGDARDTHLIGIAVLPRP